MHNFSREIFVIMALKTATPTAPTTCIAAFHLENNCHMPAGTTTTVASNGSLQHHTHMAAGMPMVAWDPMTSLTMLISLGWITSDIPPRFCPPTPNPAT